jgi:outer membrane protein assembly factor BamA
MAKLQSYRCLAGIIFVLFLLMLSSNAQTPYKLIIQSKDCSDSCVRALQLQTAFSNKISCLNYIQQLPTFLAAKGYISASVDSVYSDSTFAIIQLFVGKKYVWRSLTMSREVQAILSSSGHLPDSWSEVIFQPEKVQELYNNVLNACVNNGYPFAKVYLSNIQLENGEVTATLELEKGAEYFIDSIAIIGNAKISQNFIHQYLEIGKHEPYSAEKLNAINQKILSLPYLQQTQPWNVSMMNTGAILNLYLQQKPSNEIDVLIGFLPSNQELGGKLLVTGEANINLKNAFAAGEQIALHWQQLQSKSPQLNLMFQKPYIFHSNLGIDGNFELYKRDSFFLNIQAGLGLQYLFSAHESSRIFFQTLSTHVLNVDTMQIKLSRKLPDIIDVSSVSLGLQYNFTKTNYRFNPRNGNELEILLNVGNKKIHKNNTILQLYDSTFNFEHVYDSLKLNSYRVTANASYTHYIPLGKQAVLKTALHTGWLQSDSYFINELFRLGGYKLLRGFDEESIYANRYGVLTIEYRLLLAQNSYFAVFTDVGRTHFENRTTSYSRNYIGMGLGLALQTKTGIFNISYALGKESESKLDLQKSKIHVGFISLF